MLQVAQSTTNQGLERRNPTSGQWNHGPPHSWGWGSRVPSQVRRGSRKHTHRHLKGANATSLICDWHLFARTLMILQ